MTAEMTAIKNSYEVESMTPEEIALDRGLEETAVKACLMQVSSKYRKACNKEEENTDNLNFSNEQLAQVNDVIFELAICAEDPHLRGRMATYIRDDKKGRREVVKQQGGNNFNVLMINQQLQKVRELASSAKSFLPAPPSHLEVVNV